MSMLITTFCLAIGINLIMFLPAYCIKTDKLTDISYAITFIVLALYGLLASKVTLPSIFLFLMILVWAVRLGSYLLIRIRKIGKDKRFDNRREKFWSFSSFWLLQGFTVWIVLIPSTLFFGNSVEVTQPIIFLGIFFWLTGLLVETVADWQKYQFKNDPKNKGRWIESGLWKYSRHPNYFGEILLWFGVYLYTLYGLDKSQALIGFIGPVYTGVLIIFVSGIPLLEKSSDKRWGNNSNYKKYKEKTSILIPLPLKKKM